jgi:hypothetical protein
VFHRECSIDEFKNITNLEVGEMLLHKQGYFQELREREREDVRDMILVAINEATKFSGSDSEKAEDFGVDFSNIPPINAIIIDDVLQSLGYILDFEPELDGFYGEYSALWDSENSILPPMGVSGVALEHKIILCRSWYYGVEETYEVLEENPKYAKMIEHGKELISKAVNRSGGE